MEDNIFKPLTHLDREGPEANNDRFQRRDNTNFHTGAFEAMDTGSTNPQKGWNKDDEAPAGTGPEANGCACPEGNADDGPIIYQETVVVEFYDDSNDKQ